MQLNDGQKTDYSIQSNGHSYFLLSKTKEELQKLEQQETLVVFWYNHQQAYSVQYKEQITNNELKFPQQITGSQAQVYILSYSNIKNLKVLIILREIQQRQSQVISLDQETFIPQIFRVNTTISSYNVTVQIEKLVIDVNNNLSFETLIIKSFNHEGINYEQIDIMYQFISKGQIRDSYSTIDYQKGNTYTDETYLHIDNNIDWENYDIEVKLNEKKISQKYDIGIYIIPNKGPDKIQRIIVFQETDLDDVFETREAFVGLQTQEQDQDKSEQNTNQQQIEQNDKLLQLYQEQTQLFQVDKNIYLKQKNNVVQCIKFFEQDEMEIKDIEKVTIFNIVEGKQYQNLLLEWNKYQKQVKEKWKPSDLLKLNFFNQQEILINRSSYLYFEDNRQIFNPRLFQDMDCKILKYSQNKIVLSLGEIYQDILKYKLFIEENVFKFELSINNEEKTQCEYQIDQQITINQDTKIQVFTMSQNNEPIEVIFANKIFDQNQVEIFGPNLGDIDFENNNICIIDPILYSHNNSIQVMIFPVEKQNYYIWYIKAYYFEDYIKILYFKYQLGNTPQQQYLTYENDDYKNSTEFYLVTYFNRNQTKEFLKNLKNIKQQFLYFNNKLSVEYSPEVPRQLLVKFVKLDDILYLFIAESKKKLNKPWFAAIYTLNEKNTKIKSTLYDLDRDEIIYQNKKIKDVSSFNLSNIFSSSVIPQTISCIFGLLGNKNNQFNNIIYFDNVKEECKFNRLNMFVKILIPYALPEDYQIQKGVLSIDMDSLYLQTFLNLQNNDIKIIQLI